MHQHPIETWHSLVQAHNSAGLDDLLAGRSRLSTRQGPYKSLSSRSLPGLTQPSFQYLCEMLGPSDAMLGFETEIDGVLINGVDIINWNASGEVTEFKVMIRR